jgi:hypothetical protein
MASKGEGDIAVNFFYFSNINGSKSCGAGLWLGEVGFGWNLFHKIVVHDFMIRLKRGMP